MYTAKKMMSNNKFKGQCLVLCLLLLLFFFPAHAQVSNDEQLAYEYARNGECDKAVILYEKIYDKNTSRPVYEAYLKCLLALKESDKAEKLVKKSIKRKPDDPLLYIDLGIVYTAAGHPEKAGQQYDKAIKLVGSDNQQIVAVAEAFVAQGLYDPAIATYQKGKRLLQHLYPFNFELAQVFFLKGDYAAMFDEYLDMLLMGDNYIQAVQNALQSKLTDKQDDAQAALLRTALLKKIQRYPEKEIYYELLIWYLVQQRDFEPAFMQSKALDKRFREDGGRMISLAELCTSNKAYDVAVSCYQYVIEKGAALPYYTMARMELLEVMNLKLTSGSYTQDDLLNLEKDYYATLHELGRSTYTVPLIKGLAHLQAFYLNKTDTAQFLLEQTVGLASPKPQLLAECKLELGDVLLMQGDVWEATLLYSQVDKAFKHDPVGEEAKFRNAKLSYYRGDFDWAKAQLDILKAGTSHLIANDALSLSLLISDNTASDTNSTALLLFARADLLLFRNRPDEAFAALDTLEKQYPEHPLADDILFRKALVMKKKKDTSEEIKYLSALLTGYPGSILADDALFELGETCEYTLKDLTKAKEYYEQLLTSYPGSLFVTEARRRYRILRGDTVN